MSNDLIFNNEMVLETFCELVAKGTARLRTKLGSILGSDVPIDRDFAESASDHFETITNIMNAGIPSDEYGLLYKLGPTIGNDTDNQFSYQQMPERTQRPDRGQCAHLAMCLNAGHKEVRLPVYFYQNGKIQSWYFWSADLAIIAYWYGLQEASHG